MKKASFEKAQELSTRIDNIDNAIKQIKDDTIAWDCFYFVYDEDLEAMKIMLLSYFRHKRRNLRTEFSRLK